MSAFLPRISRENFVFYALASIVVSCAVLLFTGSGILVGEEFDDTAPNTGEVVNIGGIDVKKEYFSRSYISCSYFSGRSVVEISLDASEYAQCPFLNSLDTD